MECSDSNRVCDADLLLSDPAGTQNDSLLDISCKTKDCMLVKWRYRDIKNVTKGCTRSTFIPLTPMRRPSGTVKWEVCQREHVLK